MCACPTSPTPPPTSYSHFRHTAGPPVLVLQRVPSPSGDPVEAARGGLRRGRSAAAIKE